jgi:hypothetical protein
MTCALLILIRSSYTFSVSRLFFFSIFIIFTDGRTPWTSDQLVTRPLPKHRATKTQNKHIHIPHIHALCRIRTHDPGFRASEDSTCLRQLGYCDRLVYYSSPSIIRMIRWAGYLARTREKKNAHRILVGKPEGKRSLGKP